MKIIANTGDGYLIEATNSEVKEILSAVLGSAPKEIEVGQKIPAIDYASTIRKVKGLPESHAFSNLIAYAGRFNEAVQELNDVVNNATDI